MDVHDEIIKNRVIMNFKQDGTRTEQVLRSLEAMISTASSAAETIIVDGYDFALAGAGGPRQVQGLRREARPGGLVQRLAQGERRSHVRRGRDARPAQGRRGRDRRPDHAPRRRATTSSSASSRTSDHPAPGLLKLKLDPKTLLIM